MARESKQPQIAIAEAIHLLQKFRGADLTQTILRIEKSLKGASADSYAAVLTTSGAKAEVLGAAGLIKHLAGPNQSLSTARVSCQGRPRPSSRRVGRNNGSSTAHWASVRSMLPIYAS